MALDTAAKRKSAIGVGLLCLRLGVIPDGTNLSAPQRLHTDFLYSGIAASSVVEVFVQPHSAWACPVVMSR